MRDKVIILVSLAIGTVGKKLLKNEQKRYADYFIADVIVNTNNGTFFCRKASGDFDITSYPFEHALREYFLTHANGDFIDVGANIGLYTVMMARKLDRDSSVIAFEPDPSNFESLKVNVHLNGIGNVSLHNLGLWFERGELPLFADPKNPEELSRLTFKPTFRGSAHKLHGHVAQVDTLDHIMETEDVQCNLIKIDAEGAEFEVLKGGIQTLRRYKPDVIFECFSEEELGAIEQLLLPMGYVISSTRQESYYLASVHEIETNRK